MDRIVKSGSSRVDLEGAFRVAEPSVRPAPQEDFLPATLKDIAARMGLSVAAVSMAMNGKPGVSEETRERVHQVAEEIGYRINRSGRSLRTARTGAIGVYFPSTVLQYSLYFAEVTRGIAAGLASTDHSPILLPSALDTGDVQDFPAVDGFIVVEPHSDDLGMRELLKGTVPTVCVDPPPADAARPWGVVEPDTEASTIIALDRMLERGTGSPSRPGLLTVERVSQWTLTIEQVYLDWCRRRGIEPEIILISAQESNEKVHEQLSERLTGAPGACDGLFVCGEGVAVRIAGVLRSMGHTVGESVLLVSGVDSTMMQFHTPSITSVDMNPFDYGQRAAQMMVELLAAPERPAETRAELIESPLVVRESC